MNDLISRQQAIDALGEEPVGWSNGEYELGRINQWKSDMEAIKALPPAEPQECKGYWVDENGNAVKVINGIPQGWSKCSKCGEWLTASDEYPCIGKFCPNCGQRMEVEHETD